MTTRATLRRYFEWSRVESGKRAACDVARRRKLDVAVEGARVAS
jgi:hypothetical protein